jgi:hypothetical protein
MINSRLAHDLAWQGAVEITKDVKPTVPPEEYKKIFAFVYDTICSVLISYAAAARHQEQLLRPFDKPKASEN